MKSKAFADETVTEAEYVIENSDRLSQLLEETEFSNDVLDALNDILNDGNTAVVICWTVFLWGIILRLSWMKITAYCFLPKAQAQAMPLSEYQPKRQSEFALIEYVLKTPTTLLTAITLHKKLQKSLYGLS